MKALFYCAGLLCFTQTAFADTQQTPDEIQLTPETVPVDIWQKNRFEVSLTDGEVALRDIGTGPFDDASFWEIDFNAALPFGPKEFWVDVVVGDDVTTLWGNSLLQPLINGKEAVPSLDENGVPTSELSISADDGKGFVPAISGTYSFQIPADAEMISSFSFMTAGAENYDVKLSNFRVRAWPEEDDRTWPQRPQVSTLGYRMDRPVVVFVDWYNDIASQDQAAVDLTLTGPDGAETISVTLPTTEAAISGSHVSQINLGLLPVGDYTLDVPAIGERTTAATANFTVTEDNATLLSARDDAWSAFYWITSGEYGPYPDAHAQDATAQAFGAPDITADISGGWYDAGDYGKYSVNGAYAATMMLLTGLIAPEPLGHTIDPVANAPAEVADWLRVLDAQLGWLINMQRADGGVYHKVTTQKWPAMSTTPEDDTDIKWLMPVSSTATGDFAGAMALAAAVYRDQTDPAYQERATDFESAAKRALDWLDANPEPAMAEVTYDGDAYGGPYNDSDDTDERFFATAAYAAVTGDPSYMERVEEALNDRINAIKEEDFALNWQQVGMLGIWALATSDELSAGTKTIVHEALSAAAAYHSDLQEQSVWNLSIADDGQLVWGSNSVFATAVWHWLLWAELSGESAYVENAETQLHYFFGLNPLGQTYITGEYPNATAAPHFRPWSSGRIALPAGLIAGGPNSTDMGGDPLTGALSGQAPLRMYADDVDSFATNEVAINWQATWALSASLLTAAQAAAE